MRKKSKVVKKNKVFESRFKNKLLISFGTILLATTLYISFKAVLVKAETATFYPNSCLGGWTNPFRAAAKPDVSDDNTNSLSNDNSALLPANTNADIFCGDFKGTIPENSQPQKIILSFSWDVAKNNGQDTQNVSSDNFRTSAGEILDASSSGDVNFTLTETSKDSSPTTAEPVQTPVENTPDSAPTSFLNMFATPVFADDEVSTTTVSSEIPIVEVSTTSIEVLKNATASDEEVVATTTAEVISTTSQQTVPSVLGESVVATSTSGNEILEVFYTLDGKDWQSLGRVDAVHLRYSIFEIPIPPETTWGDLTGLQISVKSLLSVDNTPAIFLDGMKLQVSYGKVNTEPFVAKSGLYFSSADTKSPTFNFKLRNHEGIQEIVVNAEDDLGSLAVFNSDSGILQMYTYAAVNHYVIQPETFGEGNYTFIRTPDPQGCTNISYIECKMGALGNYGDFTVIRQDSQDYIKTTTPAGLPLITTSTIEVSSTTESSSTSDPVPLP